MGNSSEVSSLFPGFDEATTEVDGVRIHHVTAGDGPPVLLLHGYPQTLSIWHEIAAVLAESHTVVAADLRGYGDSDRPPSRDDHSSYSKRRTAADQVGLMRALGHERFALVGHDRGGRVGHRTALDHPEAVTRLADTADPVPDPVWADAAAHFDTQQLGALVLTIASINLWNRLNVTTRQVAGQSW